MTITPEMQAHFDGRVYSPVFIVRLDIETDPIRAWNGPGPFAPTGTGDPALDGLVFDPVSPLVNISDAKDDQGSGGPLIIAAAAHDLDEELLRQIVRDKRTWQLKRGIVWLGALDETEGVVLPDPIRYKTGVITAMDMTRDDDTALFSVEIDEDLGNRSGRPLRVAEHSRFFSDDTFGNFVQKLANRPAGFEGSATPSGGGGGGGGGGNDEISRNAIFRV